MATTYSYEDICEKPFRKISERTVDFFPAAAFVKIPPRRRAVKFLMFFSESYSELNPILKFVSFLYSLHTIYEWGSCNPHFKTGVIPILNRV